MSENQNYQFYCLSFNNERRKENMQRIFKDIDINCKIYEGVSSDDVRLSKCTNSHQSVVFSCMYGHLDMINDFYYNTNKDYGIFCEDDIAIHKDLKTLMPNIIRDFSFMKLDVLLLGYLLPFKLEPYVNYIHFPIKYIQPNNQQCRYYNYPNDLWGTQMYMLSRDSAKKLLDKYNYGYADDSLCNKTDVPFSADWTLTKDGNRAMIYPMLALENNTSYHHDIGQRNLHQGTFNIHYSENLFII